MLPTLSSDWSMQLYFLRPSMGEFFSQCKSRKKENSKSFKHILEDKYEVRNIEVQISKPFTQDLQALGPIKFHEIATLCLFCTIVIIWFFRSVVNIKYIYFAYFYPTFLFLKLDLSVRKPGFMPGCTICILYTLYTVHSVLFRKPGFMPGWTSLFNWSSIDGSDIGIATGTPTLLIVVLFFIIPADIVNDPK